jgi:hypothetical protein
MRLSAILAAAGNAAEGLGEVFVMAGAAQVAA